MGIKGLVKLIGDKKDSLCARSRLRGELVVDGFGVLHELYELHNLDWMNGGCYAKQQRVTLDYFEALVRADIKPIVVVDGGGSAVQHSDTVHRRNKDIKDIPEQLERCHTKSEASHLVPVMAREVFVSSLRESGMNVDVKVADGKATKTIVRLANYYGCPILTNSTNYCVCGISGGVVLFKYLDIKTCEADVYEQTRLISLCRLPNPDLIYAIVAILGDNSDTLPYLYHGRVKPQIEAYITGIDISGRSKILNVADYLRVKKFASFSVFMRRLESLGFGRQWESLLKSCEKAGSIYDYSSVSKLSLEELEVSASMKCSKPCDLSYEILQSYRMGTFPVLVINAITLGECVLEQVVGDQQQPPPCMLGLPIRQLMYGLASGLMNEEAKAVIREYHRCIDGSLKYEAHDVSPSNKFKELSLVDISCLDEKTRRVVAVNAICDVLECQDDIVQRLESYSNKSLAIITLVTRFWAKHLIRNEVLSCTEQLIKALVVNFFFNSSDQEVHRPSSIDESMFPHPEWIKIYHALLEWQSLYQNVCGLNYMLLQPLNMRSFSYFFDGPFIFYLALNPPEIIDNFVSELDAEKAAQYKNVLELVVPSN